MDSSSPKPPRPSDRLPKPSDRPLRPSDKKSKGDKGPLYKDRRTHRIELRQKITALKEEINELKAIETDDEEKKAELRERISELHIKVKECTIEKEAIENFNHTQFVNNLEASEEGQDRYTDESTGNTRFFEHLKGSSSAPSEEPEQKKSQSEPADPFLQVPDDQPPS